jgi:hypothetical protein
MSRWRESSGVSSGSTIVPPAVSSCWKAGELAEVLEVVHRRVAPHGSLTDERRAVHRRERHVVTADVERVLRVPRLHVELPRRLRHLLEHEVGIERDEIALDLLTRLRERVHGLREEELDSELGDDPPPATVEGRDGVLGEDLVARHPVHEHLGGPCVRFNMWDDRLTG